MFVFNTEQGPHTSTTHFREPDEEAEERGVLQLARKDRIEDPVETEYRVDDHGKVVHPRSLVAENVAQKRLFRVRIAET